MYDINIEKGMRMKYEEEILNKNYLLSVCKAKQGELSADATDTTTILVTPPKLML